MGSGTTKKWQFVFGEHQGFSASKEEFQVFGKEKPQAYGRLQLKLELLQMKPLERLIEPEILLDVGNGLWRLEVAGGRGTYYFLGSVEYALGKVRFVALAGYKDAEEDQVQFAQQSAALVRLQKHLSKAFQKYVFYGIPKLK